MQVALEHDRAVVLHGSCKDVCEVLDENSVDSIVCDPPAGISFMGKGWDKDHGGRDGWIAWLAGLFSGAYRALKPGGYLLVWAIPRTSHWTATALENAGFEIRDVHHDLLSQDEIVAAFYDSLDDAQRLAFARICEAHFPAMYLHLFGTGFPKSLDISKAVDAHLGAERIVVGTRPGTGTKTFAGEENGKGLGPTVNITMPATPEAAKAEGVGTALKPAVEHWILARKPLEGTYAENFIRYGTGGLNIDECRVGDEVRINAPGNKAGAGTSYMMAVHGMPADAPAREVTGRWPSHLTLDEGTAPLLDKQKADASRFYYIAKGSRKEKDHGLDHMPKRSGGEATDREDGSAGLGNPRAGAGRTGGARNFHPTVKSIALMEWLVKLVTPVGGTVLDLFAGSGTTGVAALKCGRNAILVELDEANAGYVEIITGRIQQAIRDFCE